MKQKPTSSLANYDIKYLVAWYRAWVDIQGTRPLLLPSHFLIHVGEGKRPNLVVMLHEFEQFDSLVMQDIFHICRQASLAEYLASVLIGSQ